MKTKIMPRLIMENALEGMEYYQNLFLDSEQIAHIPLTKEMAEVHNLNLTDEELCQTTLYGAIKIYNQAIYFMDNFITKKQSCNIDLVIGFDETWLDNSKITKLIEHLEKRDDLMIAMPYAKRHGSDYSMAFTDKYNVSWTIFVYSPDSQNKIV